MYVSTFALLATAVVGISAIPFTPSAPLGKRDWVNNNKGNLKITFSDDTIKLGTAPISVLIGNISTQCSTQGQCDTSSIAVNGYQLVSGGQDGEVDDETITISPSGAYPTWIHNGLMEALGAAVNAVAKCSQVTNDPSCPSVESYCPEQPYTVTECTVPAYWGVNYQAADSGDSAPPYIGASLSVKYDNGAGFCSTFTTIGAAVAGAVNGVAGGIFTLASLACGSSN